MFAFLVRSLAALAAGLALVGAWFNFGDSKPARGAPFSRVLAELRAATSLELRVSHQGRAAQVLVSAPGSVRYQETAQRYRIAAGSRLWRIDESTNTAVSGDSPWFRNSEQQVDLLSLLELNISDASPLLNARPTGRGEYDGKLADVYRADLPSTHGALKIEAYADAATGRLLAVVARDPAAPAGGPPVAEMQLLAMNTAVDPAKFAVAGSLSEDGRIGKISDAQGVVGLRPLTFTRWTPVTRELLLKPGDWLRTEVRGANAAKVRLTSDVELTLGPGTLLECISPVQARLHTGEVQITMPQPAAANAAKPGTAVEFELLAPRAGSQKFAAAGKSFVRVDRVEKLVAVTKQADWPKWLAGFEGTSANQSLGSLIVNVDGRNEPLTVGYHKVSVEIRDQIARTTIEESFVNHTKARLEGVFHFPLPQDASISNFGMWIGNELVEADVVEKQRAREIYETILREKRDPGLLEWTSGNLFKARVFPIEAESEKRVKIVYTQVLPLRANKYHYSYALRSDLLRTKPLRELSLNVTVNSALPLKNVTCSTHPVRAQHTEHSGQVSFAAQEYTPNRDFEMVCEIDGKQSDVVVVPHRRGDDGYLLVQVNPPTADGNWQREVLPDGQPLNLILLCDTSGSMDSERRKQQAELVGTMLASLGEKDRFWLAATDASTAWASLDPQPPTAENIAKSRDFLDVRTSLGWTDLDQAYQTVLRKAPPGAHVVYIGDGIISAHDRDPSAFVRRLKKLLAEKAEVPADKGDRKTDAALTLHAVSVGNTHEQVVLRGIANAGHGSVRAISGGQTPQIVALELLNEIAQPGLRDLNVEFRDIKVAAVYPERLPNLAAGTQQILVGRYLPQGKDQQGQVIVTGRRGTETVRYVAKVNFQDAEAGNSFIPRLWARSHLDQLLAQGQSAAINDQIIALSEEFHIITPLTSLLVLETDADRERFGVKRRYEMRDGQQFFQQGKANANFELVQQQMKHSGDWRLALRRQILTQLATLGRNPQQVARRQTMNFLSSLPGKKDIISRSLGDVGGAWAFTKAGSGTLQFGGNHYYSDTDLGVLSNDESFEEGRSGGGFGGGQWSGSDGFSQSGEKFKSNLFNGDINGDLGWSHELSSEENRSIASPVSGSSVFGRGDDLSFIPDEPESLYEANKSLSDVRASSSAYEYGGEFADRQISGKLRFDVSDLKYDGRKGQKLYTWSGHYQASRQSSYTAWLGLFPALGAAPFEPKLPPRDPEHWSAEAIAISKSLLRTQSLLKFVAGNQGPSFEVTTVSRTLDPNWKRTSSTVRQQLMFGPRGWALRNTVTDGDTIVNTCDKTQRAVYSSSLQLGQSRASTERDLTAIPLPLNDWSLSALHQQFPSYYASVEKVADDQARLVLWVHNTKYRIVYLIDTSRHVILKTETFDNDRLSQTDVFSDFVKIADTWWAKSIVTTDAKGRQIAETTVAPREPGEAAYAAEILATQNQQAAVATIRLPVPTFQKARQHVADGTADFTDRIVMIVQECHLQQWDELFQHLEQAEKLAAGKPGVRWLRPAIDAEIRRNEDSRQILLKEVKALIAAQPTPDHAVYLANFLLDHAQPVCSPAELYELLQIVKPVFEKLPADASAWLGWQDRLMNLDEALGNSEAAMKLRRALAEKQPWDENRQTDLARRLLQIGHPDQAYQWLDRQLELRKDHDIGSDQQLRTTYADLYRIQTNWPELLKFTAAWIENKPDAELPYQQHLAALIFNDKLADAHALALAWLKAGQIEAPLTPAARAQLGAAISFAQGSCYNVSFQRMDEKWYEPLAEAARYFVRQPAELEFAQRITDYRFNNSASGDRLRGHFLQLLQTELEQLNPQQISWLVGQTLSTRLEFTEPIDGRRQLTASELPIELWKTIAAQIRGRWQQADDKEDDDKHTLGEALKSIYAARFADTELLPLLRERVKVSPQKYRAWDLASLMDALLAHAWTEELEAEAFDLLPRFESQDHNASALAAQTPMLIRVVDAMLANRIALANKDLQDQGQTDKLTRTELAQKCADFRKQAMTGLADRLTKMAAKFATEKHPLAPWLAADAAWLDIKLDRNLENVRTLSWQQLGAAPQKIEPAAQQPIDEDPAAAYQRFFDAQLRHRSLITLMSLAARKDAPAAEVTRLIKYLDAGIAFDAEQAAPWRALKFQMLVALDRADDLERELRGWSKADVSTAPWRRLLALLLAERGKLDEAISIFEACQKDQLLTADDYRALSLWYQVQDRREAFEKAKLESYKQLPEGQLNRLVSVARNRWCYSQAPLPSELDESVLLAFRALFEKSSNPENYLSQLREIYGACRDFRLLQMLPDALPGRTPQQIYPFLQTVHSTVLTELRNEATADEIIARIAKLRQAEHSATDLRALDLFEALVERRSAEVLNQPGPHVERCLADLRRAFERKWTSGEQPLMASFLGSLDKLPNDKLRDEQLRELRELQQQSAPGSRERLQISNQLAKTLFWNYDRRDEGLQLLEAEVSAYQAAHAGTKEHPGLWPNQDNAVLGDLVGMYENLNRFAAGEDALNARLVRPEHPQQRRWLTDRLWALYNNALDRRGEVSLGKDEQLLESLIAFGLRQIESATDENIRQDAVTRLVQTFDIAIRGKLRGFEKPLRTFAFEQMPAILKRQTEQYRNTAQSPVQIVREGLGAAEALRYTVERMEQWPDRLQITWNSSWNSMGSELAQNRHFASDAKVENQALEARVLALAIVEIKREMSTRESHSPYIFHKNYGSSDYFWAAKTDDFAKAANEVLAEYKNSGRHCTYIADYFWHGLDRRDRAVEILLLAHRDGVLDQNEQTHLADFLQQRGRYAESIAVLQPLVVAAPEAMSYREMLMRAYFQSKRPQQLDELIKQTDDFYHRGGRWTAENVAAFGQGSIDCERFADAAKYFAEAVSRRQRANPNAGLGDGTLATYYQGLAVAESARGRTNQAVDAASAAIVCWPPRSNQRTSALLTLARVIHEAKDLDAYVKTLDEQAAASGKDSPLLRKQVGLEYQTRGKMELAAQQLELARQLQPADQEVYLALIQCYVALGKTDAANQTLLAQLDFNRHNLKLYEQLAERLKSNEAEAERAATNIIEAAPTEAENHQAMAALREKQNRWDDAIEHWQQVAELRRLEPTGLLKLAAAQIHQMKFDAARKSIETLNKTEWPSRFGMELQGEHGIPWLQSQLKNK